MEAEFVDYYNEVRLHSAIGYVAPMDRLHGRDAAIFEARDQKLEAARERRAIARRATRRAVPPQNNHDQRTENSSSR
jgi:hypothetical protein